MQYLIFQTLFGKLIWSQETELFKTNNIQHTTYNFLIENKFKLFSSIIFDLGFGHGLFLGIETVFA